MGFMEKIFGDLNTKEVKKVEKIADQDWAEKYLISEYRSIRERMGIKCVGEQKVAGVEAPASGYGKGAF